MGSTYQKILLIGETSGIDAGLAGKFIEEGFKVFAEGRRTQILYNFVQKHGSEKALSAVFDITNLVDIPEFVENVTRAHPDIVTVLLNFGIQRGMNFTKPSSVDLESFDLELTTKCTSFVNMNQIFSPISAKEEQIQNHLYQLRPSINSDR